MRDVYVAGFDILEVGVREQELSEEEVFETLRQRFAYLKLAVRARGPSSESGNSSSGNNPSSQAMAKAIILATTLGQFLSWA